MSNGIVVAATAGALAAKAIGTVHRSMTCAAATVGFPHEGAPFDPITDGDQGALTLVPVRIAVPAGVDVYKVTFADHADDTLAAYTAATPSVTLTTALGGNDDPNGGLIYTYGGTGPGQVNVITDYVDATKVATLVRRFETAVSTDTTAIILEGEGGGAANGIQLFGRIDAKNATTLQTDDGSADGDFAVFMDIIQAPGYLKNLTLPVIAAHYLFA